MRDLNERATPNSVFVFLACLSLLPQLACQDRLDAAPDARVADFLSFASAIEQNHVSSKNFDLGPVTRAALLPAHQPSIAPETLFESNPVEIIAGSELILSMGMLSFGLEIPEADQPKFRVDVVGPEGEMSILQVTGQIDFGVDEWSRRRVSIPDDLGSPVTIRFQITPPDSAKKLSASALPVWGVPRLLRPSETSRPNVLFVVFDTLRADHLQPYGYERETTPFLSKLAARGALAEQVVATYPTTLSSHWSLFTGLFPARHGIYPQVGERKAPSESILAENFQNAGYRTSAFTEGGFVHSLFGFAAGFDLYHNSAKSLIHDLSGNAKTTFDLAMTWLEAEKDDPFFLFLHTYHVHTPYEPAAAYRKQFASGGYEGRWPKRYPALATFQINNRQTEVSEAEFAHLINLYDAEIRELDDLFAQFWSQLEALDILDNTIVVITSDHGEDFFEHGWLNHGTTLYDPALMVPLIVIAPNRVVGGTRIPCQRSSTDLMPTVLEMAGLPIPEGLDGHSIAAELMGEDCREDHAAYSELVNSAYKSQDDLPIASLRKDGWKLIRHIISDELEVYDLRNDPDEAHTVATEESADLIDELDAYIETRPAYTVGEEDDVPEELRESLKALGYVE